jgi:hypothetical protein
MKDTFESILEEVSKLEYSDNGILDLISAIDKAIEISKAADPNRRTNHCLNQLLQTKEKELDFMKEKDISDTDREQRFKDACSNFDTDLRMWCINRS